MVTNNYRIATRHYSYSVLRNQLTAILKTFFGDTVVALSAGASYPKPEIYEHIDPQVVLHRHAGDACRI